MRLQVTACGVCRTDLHLAEGDLAPRRPRTVPGHEIVGVVDALGAGAGRFGLGERVGGAWLRGTCGRCRWCRSGAENLCPHARFTGWDADGGFAEQAVVPEAYAYRLPPALDDAHAAPLLRSGIVVTGRSRSALPPPAAPSTSHRSVSTRRSASHRSARSSRSPFDEKQVRSVTAHTRADGEELLRLADNLAVRPHVVERSFDQAQTTLAELAADGHAGAAVLVRRA